MDKFAEPTRYCIEQSNTAMSDTARTDEGIYRAIDAGHAMYHGAIVQKLERELAEAREESGQLKSQLSQTHGCVTISRNGYVQELERELANIKDQRDVAVWVFEKCREDRQRVTTERNKLADAALRLADIAEKNTDDTDLWETLIADVRLLAAAKGGSDE